MAGNFIMQSLEIIFTHPPVFFNTLFVIVVKISHDYSVNYSVFFVAGIFLRILLNSRILVS